MKNNSQRMFILVIVVVFFLTSVAATGIVIYDAVKGDDQPVASDASQQLEQLQNQQQGQENMLQGTKLANFNPIDNVTELQKIDLVPGTGKEVPAGATITAHYTGALVKDGTIFQSSKDMGQPISFSLDQVIQGWKEGVPGMKEGGTRRLIIPAAMAYGDQAQQGIPANSALVFDIELVSVQQ